MPDELPYELTIERCRKLAMELSYERELVEPMTEREMKERMRSPEGLKVYYGREISAALLLLLSLYDKAVGMFEAGCHGDILPWRCPFCDNGENSFPVTIYIEHANGETSSHDEWCVYARQKKGVSVHESK